MQTVYSQDQVPYMLDLILAQACLNPYKNANKPLSRTEWINYIRVIISKLACELTYSLVASLCSGISFQPGINNTMY